MSLFGRQIYHLNKKAVLTDGSERKRRMKRRHKPALIVCLLIFIVAVVGLATHIIRKYTPTRAQMDLNTYYGEVADGEAAIILGTEILETRGTTYDGEGYLPIEVVNNRRFYMPLRQSLQPPLHPRREDRRYGLRTEKFI